MQKLTITLLLLGLFCLSGICQTSGKKMLISTSSDKAREIFLQARDLKENIEYVPGDKLLRQAIELDPDFALAHLYLNTADEVKKAMDLLRYVTPGEAFLIRCADAAFKADQKHTVIYADSLVGLYPDDPTVLFFAGTNVVVIDKVKGLKYLDKAIAVNPDFAAAYNIRAYYYMYDGNEEMAGKIFRKYLNLRPKSGNGLDSYGDFLQMTGKYPEAIDAYRKAYQFEPTLSASLLKIGWSYMRNGEFNLARESFTVYQQKALSDYERLDALTSQAFVSYVEGNIKRAFTDLEVMKKMAVELKSPWYILYESLYKGFMLMETGNPAGAVQAFTTARDLVPTLAFNSDQVDFARIYSQGFLSMALGFNGKSDVAQKELAVAKQIFDKKPRGQASTNFMNLYQGLLELNRKNYQKAIEWMEPGALLENEVNQYYTGMAYDKSGNTKKAIEFYTKANRSLGTNYTAIYLNKTAKRIKELKTSN
jgi:tetratricopeptide (TPR) repeat protein